MGFNSAFKGLRHGGEEAGRWDRWHRASTAESFLSISKPPTAPDATNALPTQQMFLKRVIRRPTAGRCA